MRTSVKIALFAVFFLALGGILAGLYLYNLKAKDLQKYKPDFVISSTELQKSFESGEKVSSAKYINKIIEVSGEIASVRRGEKNTLNVSLKTGSDLSSVICTFPVLPDTTRLKTGNQVTIRGECSGYLMDVLLNNCVVVR
jgi:hypothetical protein